MDMLALTHLTTADKICQLTVCVFSWGRVWQCVHRTHPSRIFSRFWFMIDPRYSKLAGILTAYSTRLQKGEKVLIDAFDVPREMVISLIRAARERGALPIVNLQDNIVNRELLRAAEEKQYQTMADYELVRMQSVDAYIAA